MKNQKTEGTDLNDAMRHKTEHPYLRIEGRAVVGVKDRLIETAEIPTWVTIIRNSAFENCTRLTDITLHENVKTIGKRAFYNCHNLTHVEFPNSLENIGVGAFYNCRGLNSLEFPDSLKSIEDWAFYNCRIKSITIPRSVKYTGSRAFYDCRLLEIVKIINSKMSVGVWVFKGCRSLMYLILPNSLKEFGHYTVRGLKNTYILKYDDKAFFLFKRVKK